MLFPKIKHGIKLFLTSGAQCNVFIWKVKNIDSPLPAPWARRAAAELGRSGEVGPSTWS